MKIIRNNVFETNSSSTHSLTLCDTSDFEDWKNGQLMYNMKKDKLITLDEAREEYVRQAIIYKAMKNREGDSGYEYGGIFVDSSSDWDKLFTEDNLASITEEDIEQVKNNDDGWFCTEELPMTYQDYQNWLDYSESYYPIEQSYKDVTAFGYYGTNY